jgi:hypothetical protein
MTLFREEEENSKAQMAKQKRQPVLLTAALQRGLPLIAA